MFLREHTDFSAGVKPRVAGHPTWCCLARFRVGGAPGNVSGRDTESEFHTHSAGTGMLTTSVVPRPGAEVMIIEPRSI
jgi:hypothetical protein